ncbi:type II toxin-antitoxin system VapC family toxin [Haloquadratum walsbyi]|nr:type II toxin-antitoxin system VapC family toxin [Haloquadratum walsbyi]
MISKKRLAKRHANRPANMYADLDFWLALLKDGDWLTDRAESLLKEHEDDLEVSLATFIELFLVEERLSFDRERAVTAILELATYEGNPNVVYQASENIDEGLNTFDAFHAALSSGSIISSDRAYDELTGVNRIRLEPEENEDSTA